MLDYFDYIEDLGVNGLYFCLIFEVFFNYKYDMIDYLKIDLVFGDGVIFKCLVEECY